MPIRNYGIVRQASYSDLVLLEAMLDNTPVVLLVDEQRIVGRITDGSLTDLTPTEVMALLSGQAAADFSMNTRKITAVVDPTADQHAATKKYVDDNAPSFDIFDKFREFLPWTCLDAFTTGGDAGASAVVQGPSVELITPNALNDDSWLYSTTYWKDLLFAGKTTTVEMPIVAIDTKNGNTWVRMANAVADPPSETAGHFGWKTINADLYASNGSGAAQTITDTGINLVFGVRKALKVVVIQGTSAKFYVQNVLKTTHTTNLPPVGHYYMHLHARTTLAANTQGLRVARVLMERNY